MHSKKQRHAKILDIIGSINIEKQEEIVSHLQNAGYNVTQATVSRDINDLRLVKIMNDNGVQAYTQSLKTSDDVSNRRLHEVFASCVTSVVAAGNIVVVKTLGGAAQAAASAVDSIGIKEIVGCIAGDDTIMVVTNSDKDAIIICSRLSEMRR